MTILTFDLGQTTGAAAGGGALPARFWTLRIGPLKGEDDIGPALVRFRRQAAPLIVEVRPSEVWLEAALPIAAVNNRAVRGARMGREIDVMFQYMLAGAARTLCADLCVPARNAKVNTVRAYFLRGVPMLDARGEKIGGKDRVAMACVKRGWRVANDHEADAAAILGWRMAQTAGGIAA